MKIHVDHAGNGTDADPAFSGDLELALFRDLAPDTVSNVSGFAHGHYYNYDGNAGEFLGKQIFHRIANLDRLKNRRVHSSFRAAIRKARDPAGPGLPSPTSFILRRSSLAAGNSPWPMQASTVSTTAPRTDRNSSSRSDNRASWTSITRSSVQLLRGWDLVETIADVPRSTTDPVDRPLVDVKLTTTTVEPNFTDAVLLISATGTGTGTITVEVTDDNGDKDSKDFEVTAYEDTRNSPPFLRPVPNQTVPKEKILGIPLRSVDLERDYTFLNHSVLFSNNARSSSSGNTAFVLGNPGFVGPVNLGVKITQFDMSYRGDYRRRGANRG
jgi:hypothetical protein